MGRVHQSRAVSTYSFVRGLDWGHLRAETNPLVGAQEGIPAQPQGLVEVLGTMWPRPRSRTEVTGLVLPLCCGTAPFPGIRMAPRARPLLPAATPELGASPHGHQPCPARPGVPGPLQGRKSLTLHSGSRSLIPNAGLGVLSR